MPLLKRRNDEDLDDRGRIASGGDTTDRRRPDPAADGYEERVSTTTHQGWNTAVRVVTVIPGAIAAVMGAVALARIEWTDGMDSAAVDVVGVSFTPWVAAITVVLGAIAVLAAASPDRGSKLAVGAILVIGGVVILAIGDTDRSDLGVETDHGWMAIVVGAVLALGGLALRRSWSTRREVSPTR